MRFPPVRAVTAAVATSLALVAGSLPAAQAAPGVGADPATEATVSASADETRTSSCTDQGNHLWRGRAVWGGEYRDGAGVKRIVNNFVGFTSPAADATTVDYSVKVYNGAGKLISVLKEDNRAFDFEDGTAYLSRNPRNPPSAPGAAKIVVSVGDGNDGYGNCTMTFVQPTPTPTPPPPRTVEAGGPAAPGAPTNVAAAPDNASAVIFFTPPKVTDGGSNALSAVTSYTATSSPGGFTGKGTASGGITVSGLTNGTAYTFTLTATNATGVGAASVASNSVTPNARITVTAPTNGTDAAPAIQAAISGAASGRAVYLPAGTYTLTSVGVVGKAGVRFFGAGDTTIITGARNYLHPDVGGLAISGHGDRLSYQGCGGLGDG